MIVITRFAPSPTGYLHIGSLRTVLYNYLYAKKHNGKFMLRIEDTDQSRYVEGSIENMLGVLASVGLIPDEGPNNPGEKGPYQQSQRLEIYKKYIDELIEKGKAYHCFCSSERLTELREEQKSLKLPTKYDKKCRFLSEEEIQEKLASGVPHVVRLKVPENREVIFEDTVKGKIKVHTKDIDEQILLKTDGFPTYHLANVVDDHLMGVTHVIRGDEWTPSTPKHVIMYEAFGWEPPTFSHIPLLLGTDKKKLSKRTGDVSVEVFLEKGYITEAIINYISLLGWNPKTTEEFFSISELIERFQIEQVHRAGAVFDQERLEWFSGKYIIQMEEEKLYDSLITYLRKYDTETLEILSHFDESYTKAILVELKGKMKKFSDFKDLTKLFYTTPETYNPELLINEKMKIPDVAAAKKGIMVILELLKKQKNNFVDRNEIKEKCIEVIKAAEMKNGQVLFPVRVALSNEAFSPGAIELIDILGIQKSIERMEKLLKQI